MDANEDTWVSDSGAKRSKKMPRFDLIPYSVKQCLADRLEMGAEKYGEWNWQRGLEDEQWLKDGLNHMEHHLTSLMNGEFSEDSEWGHLGAIVFGCMMWCEAIVRRERQEKRSKFVEDTRIEK